MDSRRDFLKKAALWSGGLTLSTLIPEAIAKAIQIDPTVGSTFLDAEHVVFLMQENRSFDHSFGTLNGVRGFNDPRAVLQRNKIPVWYQQQHTGEIYSPFRLNIKESNATWMGCLPHGWSDQVDALNQGWMDNWLNVKKSENKDVAHLPLTLGYYTRADIPFYYALADAFTICDQHFCSSLTGTNPNRLFFWTGKIRAEVHEKALLWNRDVEFSGNADWKTFPERLSQLGLDWKIYQNEISSCTDGYQEDVDRWLGNFGCNSMEYFPQFKVKYSARYREILNKRVDKRKQELLVIRNQELYNKLLQEIETLEQELDTYSEGNFNKFDPITKDIHRRAFVTNSAQKDYRALTDLVYAENGVERKLDIPKADVLYQFRKDVDDGNLPLVSWIVPAQQFSDHPDSPWYGAWYVAEVLNILTQNPEVWKKTIFILTYDENDGYFDHVPPFTIPAPCAEMELPAKVNTSGNGKVSAGIDIDAEYVTKEQQYRAEEARASSIGLGFRVPLIIASPWTRGGWVNSEIFDHTSNLQFLETFIQHKTKRNIYETNISSWRRTICGDLTSAFRTFQGLPNPLPDAVDKIPFMEGIFNAKFKDVPRGYSQISLAAIRKWQAKGIPHPISAKQEPGQRNSCQLNYELQVNGNSNFQGQFELQFQAGNRVFKDRALGAPFTVYRYSSEDSSSSIRNYAVAAGDTICDSWEIAATASKTYDLAIHGPNGFYRAFKGDVNQPMLHVECQYAVQNSAFTGTLTFSLENRDAKDLQVRIKPFSYGGYAKRVTVKKNSQMQLAFDVSKQGYWYDYGVEIIGYPAYGAQFAGRIEAVKVAVTDPLLSAF